MCIECVIFWYPIHTCYVWDQAVQQEIFLGWDSLVHSLLKYFFKFQLWYWIQIYTTKYSNLLLIILILVWIVCSTYRKGEILMQKWHVNNKHSTVNLFTVTQDTKWSRSGQKLLKVLENLHTRGIPLKTLEFFRPENPQIFTQCVLLPVNLPATPNQKNDIINDTLPLGYLYNIHSSRARILSSTCTS